MNAESSIHDSSAHFTAEAFESIERRRETFEDIGRMIEIRQQCESAVTVWKWARYSQEPFAFEKLGEAPVRRWGSNARADISKHYHHGFDEAGRLRIVTTSPVIHLGRSRADVTYYWREGHVDLSAT